MRMRCPSKGHQVEWAFPTPASSPLDFRHLAMLCLPEGAHNVDGLGHVFFSVELALAPNEPRQVLPCPRPRLLRFTAPVQCTARVSTRARAADVHNQEVLSELPSPHLGAQVYFGVSFFGQLKTSEVVAQLKTSLDDKSDNTRSHVQKVRTPKPKTPNHKLWPLQPLSTGKPQTRNPKTPNCL